VRALPQNNFEVHMVKADRHADFLADNAKAPVATSGDFVFCQPGASALWAYNSFFGAQLLDCLSVSKAATQLKKLQRNWIHYPLAHARRGELIAGELPKVTAKALEFPSPPPEGKLGAFSLLRNDLMLVAPQTSSPFAGGMPRFARELEGTPSQAYLKLWEGLTRAGRWPSREQLVLDLGSSPGSWSLALSQLAGRVLSFDKAPLEGAAARAGNVEFVKKDAFKLEDAVFKNADWLFSDIICAPEKLFEIVERALRLNPGLKVFCTLKFVGDYSPVAVQLFRSIEGGRLLHLFYNKHELSFLKV
jgi:23S rRNA (cytidine2498-2'-O)-methyltransferase